jgi:hypothetical protein
VRVPFGAPNVRFMENLGTRATDRFWPAFGLIRSPIIVTPEGAGGPNYPNMDADGTRLTAPSTSS